MQKSQPLQTELIIYPARWRLIISLILCLLVLVVTGGLIISVFQTANDPGTDTLFAILLVFCIIYLSGFIWSDLTLLIKAQPSLQTSTTGLTLRQLPFLGTINLPWSEIKSVHTYRYLFLTYLCIVHQEPRQLITRYGFLRFTLNASSRFSLRTGAPLNISQSLLAQPVEEIAQQLKRDNA